MIYITLLLRGVLLRGAAGKDCSDSTAISPGFVKF